MDTTKDLYLRLEARTLDWMAKNGIKLLRVSLGIVFLWFGALKFVPGQSPAEALATATIGRLTLGLVTAPYALFFLAVVESMIGLALIVGVHLRAAVSLLLVQMCGTLTPLVLYPSLTFSSFPFAPTMEGQYILKNLVLISAAVVVGATVHGARLVSRPCPASHATLGEGKVPVEPAAGEGLGEEASSIG